MNPNSKHAFVAVVTSECTTGYGVGIATENEPGYQMVEPNLSSYEAAKLRANGLNEQAGLSAKDAFMIVASSMRNGGVA